MRMFRFSLQADTFRLVSSYTTTKEIWDRLKELYSTDEDLEHSIQTLLLSDFGAFTQKPEEKLIQTFDCFNHLLSKLMRYGIERNLIEQKVTFMNGLRPEWMAVVSSVKAHEQFKSYSLAKLIGILKSHESVVSKEAKVVSSVGSLALVSISKSVVDEEEESDMSDCDLTNEEYAMMEHIIDDKFGGVEVWSTDSEDEEVCRPSHGRAYVAREGVTESAGRCLMVTIESKHEEAKLKEDKCFAAKPVSERISDCDQLIKKKFDSSNAKLSSENKMNLETTSKFDEESEMSEILVEDEIDCSEFLKRITKKQTRKLTSVVDKDNTEGCDNYLWSAPIDNADETVGMSERTSWRVKGRYVVEPINKPSSFDKPSSNGTKEIPNEPLKASNESSTTTEAHTKKNDPKANIHLNQEQLAEQKRQRNKRYMTNLNERKQFWQSQNPTYVRSEKASNQKIKKGAQINHCQSCSQENRRNCFGTNNSDHKNQKSSFGPNSYYAKNRKSSFGPNTGAQNQKTSFGPKSDPPNSQPNSNPVKDIKGKGRREELREFWSLKDGGCVKYGNNSYGTIKGYGIITNGKFSIRKVDYVEGLQHNLISVSQLVVGTGLKVSFDDEGSEIVEKKSKKVLLKTMRKGEMYPLNINPIRGKPAVCLLTKVNLDESWLWHL
ncbi:uncharacterized protein LOC128127530 [Lactuca sativa]|uniref:uncharacterized protein LOC128127530 n=1 Tax=Lactuca sativa TaxID=4236 RepID=UPI0022AF56E6|nr:uncharacterized protein LOC128127530 [Lactuca sativa]